MDGDILIGFAMYGEIAEPKGTRVWLDRFLIDKNHQGKGYAKPVFELILNKIKSLYTNKDIYLSVYEDNEHAIKLYKSLGFVFTGELDINGEKIMLLKNCLN